MAISTTLFVVFATLCGWVLVDMFRHAKKQQQEKTMKPTYIETIFQYGENNSYTLHVVTFDFDFEENVGVVKQEEALRAVQASFYDEHPDMTQEEQAKHSFICTSPKKVPTRFSLGENNTINYHMSDVVAFNTKDEEETKRIIKNYNEELRRKTPEAINAPLKFV